MRFVLLFSALCAIATAKCKGPVMCSQGSVTLKGNPNFVTYKDIAGNVYWDDHLTESATLSCVIVVYSECSVQAFGKGDLSLKYADPGSCTLLEGKVYCECDDAHYCNIDFNRWFKAANDLFQGMDCPHLTMHSGYKQPEQCEPELPVQQPVAASCSAVKCSQGSVTLKEGHTNYVTYKDTAGKVYWDDNLQESVSSTCVIVVYSECSVQAFGKGDPTLEYAPPGTCVIKDGKVYCECNDAHYCNIDFNRWFETANQLFGGMDCPHLTMHSGYKQAEQCKEGDVSLPQQTVPEPTKAPSKKPDSAGQLNALMAVSGALAVNFRFM